ncbi:hypothetical protein BDN70DRAFT_875707 [Pholiota conissans]|uniref:Uncharacterized protein n=1 Tax=Pholiota conissans TaxID=109636 RepID=A0A9P5Z5G2_9AGAR|nr:hypothetical protein BDN70DRAFT_875707 [Pholiota conissans]
MEAPYCTPPPEDAQPVTHRNWQSNDRAERAYIKKKSAPQRAPINVGLRNSTRALDTPRRSPQ